MSRVTMHSIDFAPAIGATALALILYSLHSRLTTRSKLPLPPGPKKMPIVGNIFDLTPGFEWETFKGWSQKYNSDIIHLDVAGTSVIVLSSLEATEDLLEKRSLIYSDRPKSTMLNDLMGWTFTLPTMPYGETWRTHRRLFNQEFNIISSRNFHAKELAAAHGLLRRFLHAPDAFRTHIKQLAGEFIMSVAYGIDVLPDNDPYIELAEHVVQAGIQAGIPGRFLVDSIPILQHVPDWFPGAGFKRLAKGWRKEVEALRDLPFAETKRQIALDTAPHSFVAESFQTLRESGDTYYDESTIKATAASMYLAGSDTTVAVLSVFVLALLANPDAQKKAQMEIDAVIGHGRLPNFNDEQSLPYVSALVKEVLRWKPVAPIGVPHVLAVEDEYRGYRLPAGSIIIGNVWAIFQDEDMYPDPSAFKPERFLRDGKLNPDVRDPQVFCIRLRAKDMSGTTHGDVFIFDITKAVGNDGEIIEPSYKFSPNIISAPLSFQCSIKPRSPDAVALVEATVNGD
ncbi:cytochrome P450 [Mycena epipterygia]|nr:cytochrome P450 [Mycena epipterygia]